MTHVALDRPYGQASLEQFGDFSGSEVVTLHLDLRCLRKELRKVAFDGLASMLREELVVWSTAKLFLDLF